MGIAMIWAKRRFARSDYGTYQDRLEKLEQVNATPYRFFMVGVTTADSSKADCYVGLPSPAYLAILASCGASTGCPRTDRGG
jgi:hypothetical protein